jgi:hypothetical protein
MWGFKTSNFHLMKQQSLLMDLLRASRISRLFISLFILYENRCCNISQRLIWVSGVWPIKLTSAELTQKHSISLPWFPLCAHAHLLIQLFTTTGIGP